MNENDVIDLPTYSPKALSPTHATMVEDPNGEYVEKRDVLREISNLRDLAKKWHDLEQTKEPETSVSS